MFHEHIYDIANGKHELERRKMRQGRHGIEVISTHPEIEHKISYAHEFKSTKKF